MALKYLIIRKSNGVEHAVIFPDDISHSEAAAKSKRVVAAGFCSLNPIDAWGWSDSLGISGRPHDIDIIRASFAANLPCPSQTPKREEHGNAPMSQM